MEVPDVLGSRSNPVGLGIKDFKDRSRTLMPKVLILQVHKLLGGAGLTAISYGGTSLLFMSPSNKLVLLRSKDLFLINQG